MSTPENNSEMRARFLETDPERLLSARAAMAIPYYKLEQGLMRVAQQIGNHLDGFVVNDETGSVASLTVTRSPRDARDGPGGVDYRQMEQKLAVLNKQFGSSLTDEAERQGFRTLMGLHGGAGIEAVVHTVEEIQDSLPDARVEAGVSFALRPGAEEAIIHKEPVGVIRAPLDNLAAVYDLSYQWEQKRFIVENLEAGQTYAVETAFCSETESDYPPEAHRLFDRKFTGHELLGIMELGGHGVGATMHLTNELLYLRRELQSPVAPPAISKLGNQATSHPERVAAFMERTFSGRELASIAHLGSIGINQTLSIIDHIETWQKDDIAPYPQWTYPA